MREWKCDMVKYAAVEYAAPKCRGGICVSGKCGVDYGWKMQEWKSRSKSQGCKKQEWIMWEATRYGKL